MYFIYVTFTQQYTASGTPPTTIHSNTDSKHHSTQTFGGKLGMECSDLTSHITGLCVLTLNSGSSMETPALLNSKGIFRSTVSTFPVQNGCGNVSTRC